MRQRNIITRFALFGCCLFPSIAVIAEEPKSDDSHVEVELLANQSAVSPGSTVELAVRFVMDPEWHIYWRNRGEGGLDTTIRWSVPEGFEVGETRFPRPTRYVDASGAHTFVHEDEAVMMTVISVPEDLDPGRKVTLGADVEWLVCKKICILGEKSLSIEMPVVADQAEIEPANADLFDYARQQFPVPNEKAPHLDSLDAVASVEKIVPGKEFKIGVVLDIGENWHINSHKPLSDFFVATDVFHERAEGLQIGRAQFPEGHLEDGLLPDQKMSIYRDKVVVTLPVTANKGIDASEITVRGIASYQACNDKTKMCDRPVSAEWSVTLPVAPEGASVAQANQAVFTGAEVAEGQEAGEAGADAKVDDRAGMTDASEDVAVPTDSGWLARAQMRLQNLGTKGYLLMALIGGFILNLMPCVLPVISIKVLSFVQQAKESRLRVFTLGLSFAGGIMLSFIVLGVLIVLLGQQWGGLFQSPHFVIILAAVVLAFAMSLFGVFSLFPPKVVSQLGDSVQPEGHLGSFGMGLLATVLGTACTAPFLSAVIAIAIQQPPVMGMLIFVAAGFGMAFPYVLLAAQPAWVKIVPKPGRWMTTFEHIVGFALLGTVIWLLYPLTSQLGAKGLFWTLLFLLFVAVGVWFYGKVDYNASKNRKVAFYSTAAVLIVGGWFFVFGYITDISSLVESQRQDRLGSYAKADNAESAWEAGEIPWRPYTRERMLEAVNSGKTVFIDYTADWCVNCKANERLFINTEEVRAEMQELGVVPFKADFTVYDKQIKEDLDKYGRSGVPMYLVIPANEPDNAIVLNEVLTQSHIIENLQKAGPSVTAQVEAQTAEDAVADEDLVAAGSR